MLVSLAPSPKVAEPMETLALSDCWDLCSLIDRVSPPKPELLAAVQAGAAVACLPTVWSWPKCIGWCDLAAVRLR